MAERPAWINRLTRWHFWPERDYEEFVPGPLDHLRPSVQWSMERGDDWGQKPVWWNVLKGTMGYDGRSGTWELYRERR